MVMEQQIKIHIQDKEKNEKDIYADKGSILFDVLIRNGISFKGNCGKKRACTACMVYFEKEQEWMKSCSYRLNEDISIQISGLIEENMVLLSGAKKKRMKEDSKEESITMKPDSTIKMLDFQNIGVDIIGTSYGLAIDLGTTTIAFLLFDLKSQKMIDQFGVMNPQRIYGADVASRISYADEVSKVRELKRLFEDAFEKAIDYFKQYFEKESNEENRLEQIGISGNTVMMHILQEFPLTSLGSFPFATGNVEEVNLEGKDFFLKEELKSKYHNTKVLLSPCSSAYIGGDVLLGAVSEGFDLNEEISLFLDLGTNGEMILGKKGEFFYASTAAGTAFEGSFRTQHIHGTRLIDFLVQARRQKWLDEYGNICDRFFEKEFLLG